MFNNKLTHLNCAIWWGLPHEHIYETNVIFQPFPLLPQFPVTHLSLSPSSPCCSLHWRLVCIYKWNHTAYALFFFFYERGQVCPVQQNDFEIFFSCRYVHQWSLCFCRCCFVYLFCWAAFFLLLVGEPLDLLQLLAYFPFEAVVSLASGAIPVWLCADMYFHFSWLQRNLKKFSSSHGLGHMGIGPAYISTATAPLSPHATPRHHRPCHPTSVPGPSHCPLLQSKPVTLSLDHYDLLMSRSRSIFFLRHDRIFHFLLGQSQAFFFFRLFF